MILFTVLAALVNLCASAADDSPAKTDMAKLQGSWSMVSGSADGQEVPKELLADSKRVGKGDETQHLCRRFDVAVVGIRTWRYRTGQDEIEINDHFTVPSGPEDMLPKILRPH